MLGRKHVSQIASNEINSLWESRSGFKNIQYKSIPINLICIYTHLAVSLSVNIYEMRDLEN